MGCLRYGVGGTGGGMKCLPLVKRSGARRLGQRRPRGIADRQQVYARPIALTRTSIKWINSARRGAAVIVATEEQEVVGEVKRLTDGKQYVTGTKYTRPVTYCFPSTVRRFYYAYDFLAPRSLR